MHLLASIHGSTFDFYYFQTYFVEIFSGFFLVFTAFGDPGSPLMRSRYEAMLGRALFLFRLALRVTINRIYLS